MLHKATFLNLTNHIVYIFLLLGFKIYIYTCACLGLDNQFQLRKNANEIMINLIRIFLYL